MIWRSIVFSLMIICLIGCSVYRPVPLDQAAVDVALKPPSMGAVRLEAEKIQHPLIKPLLFNDRDGLSPEEAAVMAVIVNPQLRAIRDQRGLASAQLLQAGILPNPQISYSLDFPSGANPGGLVNAYGLGMSWEITSLIARSAKINAAKAHVTSVDLDIAWQEWQVAQAAKLHVYRLASARQQLDLAREIEKGLEENSSLIQKAAAMHNKTDIDLAAAEASRQQAQAARLALEREVNTERLGLNVALGLPPDQEVMLQDTINPSLMMANHHPTSAELLNTLEDHRLDLLALKTGYQSQESTLRAAIRSQFPKINLGFTRSRDTSDITTSGFGATFDLPFFDRNQGQIALEKATRQQLFDEYVARVAEARAEVIRIVSDSESVQRQVNAAEETVPALERLVKAYEKALSNGNADILSYYETRNNLTTKRLEIIKLQQDLTDLSVALEIASGCSSVTYAQEGS